MPAYIVVRQHAEDPDHPALVEYRAANSALVERHGGWFVVRGGNPVALEGDAGDRVVVIAFPDRAAAMAWYEDPDYVAIRPLRLGASTTEIVVVDGVA
jgi:uncharacterized protein (DUF1330 family)